MAALSFIWTYLFPTLGMGLLVALLFSKHRERVLWGQLVQTREERDRCLSENTGLHALVQEQKEGAIAQAVALDEANKKGQEAQLQAGALALHIASGGEVDATVLAKQLTEAWNAK